MLVNQTDAELDVQFSRVWMIYTGVFAILLGLVALALAAILRAGLLDVALGLAFIVGGAIGVLKAERQRTVIRKDGNTTIERSRIIGGKTTVQEVVPAEIATVHFHATHWGTGGESNLNYNEIFLVLQDQRKVSIDFQWAYPPEKLFKWNLPAVEPLTQEAQIVADFLNVPLTIRDLSGFRPFARNP
jgi:membrane protein implicated in regulation of membrane protease activity